jgi:hypothetical protein
MVLSAPLRGSQIKAPGFAGGYLLSPPAVGQHQYYGFARCAELYDDLDSGLRRNDGCFGTAALAY